MKKIATGVASLGILGSFVPQAFAATGIGQVCSTSGNFSVLCGLTAQNLGPIVGSFITFIFVIVSLVALGWLVFGGFKWLVSQGEKTEVENARNHIIAAIIGLIIIFLSYLVINILLAFLTNGKVGLGNLSIPSLGQP